MPNTKSKRGSNFTSFTWSNRFVIVEGGKCIPLTDIKNLLHLAAATAKNSEARLAFEEICEELNKLN